MSQRLMKKNLSKKILVVLLLVVFLLPSSFLIKPQEVEAGGWPTFDFSNFIQMLEESFREEVLDGIAWAVAKALVAQITQQTINWINNGFDGNPLYITNKDAYFSFICTQTFNRFMDKLGDDTSYSPEEKRVIARSLLAARPCAGERRVTDTRTIAQEVLDDYHQDFRRGGWDVWRRQITNSQNTIYGQYAKSSTELNSLLRQQAQNTERELDWASGFLSSQKCKARNEEGECTDSETITPGSLVRDRIKKLTVESDIDQLNLADSIGEVVNALLGKLIDEIFVGAKGLLKSGDDSRRGGGNTEVPTEDLDTLTRSRDGVVRIIDVYIDNEETYQNTKNSSLVALDEAEEKLKNLEGKPSLSFFRAQKAWEIKNLRTPLREDLIETYPVLTKLNTLKTQTINAESLEEINTISKEFDGFKGETHANDLASAQEELSEINALIAEIERRSE